MTSGHAEVLKPLGIIPIGVFATPSPQVKVPLDRHSIFSLVSGSAKQPEGRKERPRERPLFCSRHISAKGLRAARREFRKSGPFVFVEIWQQIAPLNGSSLDPPSPLSLRWNHQATQREEKNGPGGPSFSVRVFR